MEWKEVTLGDLCEISSSKRIFAKEYQTNGIPFYRGKEIIEKQKGNTISNELFISRNRYEEIKAKYGVPQQRELLLTSVGTLGVPYVIKEEEFYFKDGNLTWFRHFNGLDVEYLYYWFLSPYGKNEINAKAIGSTQKALTIDSLSKFNIKIPINLEDQRRIASILSSLDRKIELNNKINADLEEMAQAIFKNWFVDFEPFKDGKFVDSELGMIPEGWKVGGLFDIAEIFDKKRKPLSGNVREKMDKIYPYYGATSCMDYVDDYIFDGIYTLIGEDGSVVKENGLPYMQYVWGKMWVNNHAHILQGKNGYSTEMIHALLSITNIKFLVTGAVQAKLSQGNMQKILVAIPPKNVLDEIRPVIDNLYSKIRSLSDENSRLSLLRDTLLPRLMSGELEVPE